MRWVRDPISSTLPSGKVKSFSREKNKSPSSQRSPPSLKDDNCHKKTLTISRPFAFYYYTVGENEEVPIQVPRYNSLNLVRVTPLFSFRYLPIPKQDKYNIRDQDEAKRIIEPFRLQGSNGTCQYRYNRKITFLPTYEMSSK
jgi:hypothetical protein